MRPVFIREKKVSRFERRKGSLVTASKISLFHRPTDVGGNFWKSSRGLRRG